VNVTIFDPWANPEEVQKEYGIVSQIKIPNEKFDAIILAVSHDEFQSLNFENLKNNISVVYDVKNLLPLNLIDARL